MSITPQNNPLTSTLFSLVNRGTFTDVTILRDTPLHFKIMTKYEDEIKGVFNTHYELLKGDREINLFEVDSIMNYIPKEWLYDESEYVSFNRVMEMSGKEITTLMVEYILYDRVPSWLKVSRWHKPQDMNKLFGSLNNGCSDGFILDKLMFLDFDTINGIGARVSLQRTDSLDYRATSDYRGSHSIYHFDGDKKVDFQAVIDAVRERYSLSRTKERSVSDAIKYSIEQYISDLVGRKDLIDEIKHLANTTNDGKKFQSSVKALLVENDISLISNGGGAGSIGEGYSLSYENGFSHGKLELRIYTILLSHRGESDFDREEMSKTIKIYKDATLWEAIHQHYQAGLFS